jgi:hypothetical protein
LPAACIARKARKARRIAQRLDEKRDSLGLAVIGEVLQVVWYVEHRGIAHGDEVRNTEAPQGRERNASGAAMGHDGESALPHPFRDARAVERHALVHVDETETVRPAQYDSGARAEFLQLSLPRASFLPEFREPARKHHSGPQSVSGAFLECCGDLVSRNSEHCALGGRRQLSERRVGREARHFWRAWVHRKDATGVAEAAQVHHDVIAERVLARRGADDRDGARREQG